MSEQNLSPYAMATVICQMVVSNIIKELHSTQNVARARQAELLHELVYFVEAIKGIDENIAQEMLRIIEAAKVPFGPDKKAALAHSRSAQSNIATLLGEVKWLTDIDFALASLHKAVMQCLYNRNLSNVSYYAGQTWIRIAQILELREATFFGSDSLKAEVDNYMQI